MNTLDRRAFLSLSAAALAPALAAIPFGAAAAEYPDRPLRLIIPFAVGGATDVIGRAYAQYLGERLGKAVAPDNRPGSGSLIGTDLVAKSEPDGYTLLIASLDGLVLQPALRKNPPYDPQRGFTVLNGIASTPITLATSARSGIKSMNELLERARAQPGTIRYGSPGVGTSPHMAFELFCKTANVSMLHVAYRGGAPAMNDLLGNHIDLVASVPSDMLDKHQAGAIKVLGITSEKRHPSLPDVPTLVELGHRDMVALHWFALAAPAGLPAAVASRLGTDAKLALQSRQLHEQAARLGFDLMPLAGQDLLSFVEKERGRWTDVIRSARLTLEE